MLCGLNEIILARGLPSRLGARDILLLDPYMSRVASTISTNLDATAPWLALLTTSRIFLRSHIATCTIKQAISHRLKLYHSGRLTELWDLTCWNSCLPKIASWKSQQSVPDDQRRANRVQAIIKALTTHYILVPLE